MSIRKKILRCIYFVVALWAASEIVFEKCYQDVSMCFTPTKEIAVPWCITIHQDGISRHVTLDEINRYHKDTCKYDCGLAYNYVVTEDKIYKIRDEHQRGSHVKNGNTGNIGICIHGNFDENRPTLKQQILVICLVNKLCLEYQIPKENIKGHRDWVDNNTSCPGKNFDLEGLKKWILI